MSLRVAVDFGTSSTCVAASVDAHEPQVVVIDGQSVVSSAVYGAADGTLFVGQEAERQAAIDPSRYEPHPKRRIDEGELLLGTTVVAVVDVVLAVLRRAVDEARRFAGGAQIDLLVLTHPAGWGVIRTRVLRQAGHDLAREVLLVPEPVAAAVFHAASHPLPPRAALAVLDLGGGTVDVSVVGRRPRRPALDRGGPDTGFRVLATRGDPNFGGADIDQLMLGHIGSEVAVTHPDDWRQLVEGRALADRRRRRVLRTDVRSAKETLSRHTYTDVPLPPPFHDVHLNRSDLERLVEAPLSKTAELAAGCIAETGFAPSQLVAIFLVGGSSRIPMVARKVHQYTGVIPVALDQPETIVARGALRAVSVDPDSTGGLPRPHGAPPPPGTARHQSAVSATAGPPITLRRRPDDGPRPPVPPRGGSPGYRQGREMLGSVAMALPTAKVATAAGTANRDERKSGHRRTGWITGVSVVLAAAVAATVLLVFHPFGGSGGGKPGRRISQYDYAFVVPDGWRQVADAPGQRKVEIDPNDDTSGHNSITVQEFRLTAGTPARHAEQLHAKLPANRFSDIDTNASYGGKSLMYYREHPKGGTIRWYVLFTSRVQVSVGCEYTDAGSDRVRGACEQVVKTMVIAD
ncbi:MAG: type VII secretion-associated protein [Sciscionella sp.]